jgi:signal transduction histidine kinase
MKILSEITLKQRLIVAVLAITAVVWVLVTFYHYRYINHSIANVLQQNSNEWMRRYPGFIVDDIKEGNILRVRNTTLSLVNDDIFASIHIRDRDGRTIMSHGREDSGFQRHLNEISYGDVQLKVGQKAFVDSEYYYYPIVDMFGTKWGEAFIKPVANIGRELVHGRIMKIVVFALGVLMLEVAVIIMIMHRMFRPLDGLSHSVSCLSLKCREGEIDVEDLRRSVNELSQGEVRSLGEQVLEFASCIKEYEDQVARMSVSAAIGEISAQVAHDMRSPLSVLTTFVNHHKMHGDSAEREFVGAADRSVRKLLNMADDFLDYGKAKTLNRAPCNLKQAYFEFVEPECSKVLREKGLSVDLNIDPHLYANIDGHKLCRTMTNLLLNAVRAVDDSDGCVEVGAMEGQPGELIVIVSDSGCGIPKDDLEKIYESFYSTDKRSGTGLGLSYCKQVVEIHNGTIDVTSEVAKGTIFTITVPNCVLSEAEVLASIGAEVEAGASVVKKRTGILGPEKVLIVDDDEDIRNQWKRLIDERGGRVVYLANSVRDAQSSLGVDYTMIDTAIVDYEYAGEDQNGVDLVGFLRRNGVKNVYLCTGYYRDEEICRRAKEAGAASVLSKPIDAREVAAIFS